MRQQALSVIVPVQPNQVADLEKHLWSIGEDIENNPHLRFRDSPSTHFARWVILNRNDACPRLYFSSNYDGLFSCYVQELVRTLGTGMEPIWKTCIGYPPGCGANSTRWQEFADFLDTHSCPYAAFFIAYPGDTVAAIKASERVRKALDEALDQSAAGPRLVEIQQALGSYMSGIPAPRRNGSRGGDGAVAETIAGPKPWSLEWILERLAGIKEGIRERVRPTRVSPALLNVEDRIVQNQMTVIVPIKRGCLPLLMLRLVLRRIDSEARGARGALAGITTIHFARWVVIDNGENLLFESNYDGNWELYIDDFVDYASTAMNTIWGNCVGFPLGGTRDIEAFKRYIRDHQIPAQVFYSAHPDSSVKNIINDLHVKNAVAGLLLPEPLQGFLTGSYGSGTDASSADPQAKSLPEKLLHYKMLWIALPVLAVVVWLWITRCPGASGKAGHGKD